MSEPSQIGAIYIFAPAKLGGAEKVVLSALEALKQEITISAIVIKEERAPENADLFCQELKERKLPYQVVATKSALDFNLAKKIEAKIRVLENKFSHLRFALHTHGYKALLYTLPVSHGRTLVHTHHGNTSHTFKVRFYERIAFFAMNFCDRVFAVSKQMEHELKERISTPEKIFLVENMISLSDEQMSFENNPPAVRGSSKLKLLYAGRLSLEKGLIELISAVENRLKNDKSTRLDILGVGELEAQLKDQCLRNDLDQINFHGLQSNVANFLSKCDLLILPSYSEGLPMIVLEAAAMGVPILATDVGGIAEVVKSGYNGLLFPPRDVKALEHSLDLAELQLAQLKMASQTIRPLIRQRFGREAWAKKTLKHYQQVL